MNKAVRRRKATGVFIPKKKKKIIEVESEVDMNLLQIDPLTRGTTEKIHRPKETKETRRRKIELAKNTAVPSAPPASTVTIPAPHMTFSAVDKIIASKKPYNKLV
jgi:hypothetical protein